MIDIHTHLHFKDYDADRDEVIARAKDASVEKMILVGTDLATSRAAVELAEKHDFLFASVGVHPHAIDELGIMNQESGSPAIIHDSQFTIHTTENEGIQELMRDLKNIALSSNKVIAIGECGLDYFSRDSEVPVPDGRKAFQRERFLVQLEIAREKGLPTIIHTRPSKGSMDAYDDVFEILSDPEIADRGSKFVLHCYQGDTEVTKKFLELPNTYFSFAGSVTYPVKKALIGTKDDPAQVLDLIPAERLFAETDCPYLSPQPVRGTRNEPAYVRYTIGSVATEKSVSSETLDVTIRKTFDRVFSRS